MFSVGDKITGLPNNGYTFTNDGMLEGIVIKVYTTDYKKGKMEVQIKKHLLIPERSDIYNSTWIVENSDIFFKKITYDIRLEIDMFEAYIKDIFLNRRRLNKLIKDFSKPEYSIWSKKNVLKCLLRPYLNNYKNKKNISENMFECICNSLYESFFRFII